MRISIAGSSEQGFTLIELIVVMALISLTVSFAVPQIRSSLYTNELNGAVRRFVGLVAETGQEARLKRAAVVLRYDRRQRLFTAAPTDSSVEEESGKKYQEVRLADSVQVTDIDAAHRQDSTDLSIFFDQRGYADRTTVYFRHENGDELTVLLSPFLGSIQILEGHISLDDNRLTLTR
ncbi:prepilin-type N-terminal cleavage/methylation domain-containing protein [Desulfobulbus sp. F4]|nr:prepilin-type N-terminal cleavage/methylation domain-containing protein [Desulfobulbus sp. F3]MCW5200529.1 prepilin-type N-terminal cleavage/methylation domain-containing protein [Desulfobulbus sp. F4]